MTDQAVDYRIRNDPNVMSLRGKVPGTWSSSRPNAIDPQAPYDVARFLIESEFTSDGQRTLHYHRGGFYRWTGSHYPEMPEAELRATAYDFLNRCTNHNKEDAPVKPNTTLVNHVIDSLKAAALLPQTVEAPAWLDDSALDPSKIIVCANGLLNLATGELLPHTPTLFTHNALNFGYDRSAPEPVEWLRFLGQLWPEDPESIDTLHEIFGYFLTADTAQQKAFLLVGPRRSGKGTIARVLESLIGHDNTVHPTLTGLGTNFGLQPLIDKRGAIISDARLGGRTDQAVLAERLLSITGEDALTVDRKYRDTWTGRLTVRFLVLTNELPKIADASGALASRFILLLMTESFLGREDPTLINKLLPELPGILNLAITGWRRMVARGYFAQPTSGLEMMEELEDLGSPIKAFLRDVCEVGAGGSVTIDDLFDAWERWCMGQRRQPGTKQTFGRDLGSAVPGLEKAKFGHHNNRERGYRNIRLKEEPPEYSKEELPYCSAPR